VHTVLGPLKPDLVGPASMHEHLLLDARVWLTEPDEEPPPDGAVTLETLGFVRRNYLSSADNLVSDDPDVVAAELAAFAAAGGRTLVDLTVVGLGRRVAELPAIARRSGVDVAVGCGFYVHGSHPGWLEEAGVDTIAAGLADELAHGLDGTGIRPALVGEIGTSHPPTERELKVLRASARAAAVAGAALAIHVDPGGAAAPALLELAVAEGMAPERVILSHMDLRLDPAYHLEVARAGAVVSFDTFGHEFYLGGMVRQPTDVERCEHLCRLLDAGFAAQVVLGCDCGAKATLRRYGGHGHEHLPKRIVPALRRHYGVGDGELEQMLVLTPRRLLDR
jgi:phosphotriesterase-related protein